MSVHTHPVATYSTRMTPRKPTDPSYGKPTWETGRSPSSSDQFPSDQSLLCTSLSRVCKIHYDLQLLFCLVIVSSSTNLLTKQSSGTRKKKKKKKSHASKNWLLISCWLKDMKPFGRATVNFRILKITISSWLYGKVSALLPFFYMFITLLHIFNKHLCELTLANCLL